MKNFFLKGILAISVLSSCGAIENDVKAVAEKECECRKLEGDARKSCKEEYKKMKSRIQDNVKNMSKEEQEKFQILYRETRKACLEKE
jgi:hypothetical protein